MVKKKSAKPVGNAQLASLLKKMSAKAPRRQQVPRGPAATTMGDAATRYAHALTSPFAKEAEGVRVPEPYAIATVTRKVHVPMVLTSSASGGLDFSVQPHLVSSFVQTLGTSTGGAGAFAPTGLPAGVTCRSAVTRSALMGLVQSYRIVAIGVRIKTNVDFTKSGGRVYGAILPATQEQPGVFDATTNVGQALNCWEIPNDGTNMTSNIINLPRGFQFTVSELMSEGGCEIHFPICSARALDFLDAQVQGYEQHLTYTNNVGVQTSSGIGLGEFASAGHSQFVMRAEGLQAGADVLTCEVIYHVEGIPLVGVASLVESTPHTPAPATPNEIHMAHRIAAVVPVVSYVSEKLKQLSSLPNVGGKMAQRFRQGSQVAGAAERVLGLAVRGLKLI